MFSLVITIISIALVAALALATIYYGGTAFNKSSSSATATRIVSESQQILNAMELYKVDHGVWPTRAQLLNPDANGVTYLKAWPGDVAALTGLGQTALASGIVWTMIDGHPTVKYAVGVDLSVCKAVNQLNRGDSGIMNVLSTNYATQCYDSGSSSFVVVATKDASSLAVVDPTPGKVVSTPAPTDAASPIWSIPPGETSNPTPPGPPSGGGGTPGGTLAVTAVYDSWTDTALALIDMGSGVYNTGVTSFFCHGGPEGTGNYCQPDVMVKLTNNSDQALTYVGHTLSPSGPTWGFSPNFDGGVPGSSYSFAPEGFCTGPAIPAGSSCWVKYGGITDGMSSLITVNVSFVSATGTAMAVTVNTPMASN
jgi:hypothetical protein